MHTDPATPTTTLTLDPGHWHDTRALAHRIVDDLIDHVDQVRESPPWTRPTAAARALFAEPLPTRGASLDRIYDDVRTHVMPHTLGVVHPRFWGWVNGSGTMGGALADFIAAALNGHVAFGDQAPLLMERQVIRWFTTLFGLPEDATGLLVSSASVANLTALTVARDTALPHTLGPGLGTSGLIPRVYASAEVHNCIEKALGILGLGRDALHHVPCDDTFTISIPALRAAIQRDRAAGCTPIAIVAAAGTVNTGAVDDIGTLADVAREEGLWLHVDAAFGAAVAASGTHGHLLRGIDRADSVAFDLHKWFHVPYDAACCLIRNGEAHRRSFTVSAGYLGMLEGGIPSVPHPFGDLGPDLSRSFRALKVWMSLREHGMDTFGALVDQNIEQARLLAQRVRDTPSLELVATGPLHIVCFRHVPPGLSPDALDAHNRAIVARLHDDGIAVPSFARIRGAFAIRVCINNHRTNCDDLDLLVASVCRIGDALADRRS